MVTFNRYPSRMFQPPLPHFNNCAFYKARAAMEDADVIVANHDLVLAGYFPLGGGAVLAGTGKNHLCVRRRVIIWPDKALNHFRPGSGGARSASVVAAVGKGHGICRRCRYSGQHDAFFRSAAKYPRFGKRCGRCCRTCWVSRNGCVLSRA